MLPPGDPAMAMRPNMVPGLQLPMGAGPQGSIGGAPATGAPPSAGPAPMPSGPAGGPPTGGAGALPPGAGGLPPEIMQLIQLLPPQLQAQILQLPPQAIGQLLMQVLQGGPGGPLNSAGPGAPPMGLPPGMQNSPGMFQGQAPGGPPMPFAPTGPGAAQGLAQQQPYLGPATNR